MISTHSSTCRICTHHNLIFILHKIDGSCWAGIFLNSKANSNARTANSCQLGAAFDDASGKYVKLKFLGNLFAD